MMVCLMIIRTTFKLEGENCRVEQNSRSPRLCSEMLRAGIRDGDGIKKSGSKHHTKAAPWVLNL